jgi:phenylalanyl-tRNA synthetase beta chain
MQFSERWLRTLIDPPWSSEELAHRLTMAGLEVEASVPVAPEFSGVVVGKVLEVRPHPNADRLRVAMVDTGSGAPLTVVCGAPNVAAGMKAPMARVGAVLPGERPFEIKRAQVRGVDSEGMLCSAKELGLSDDHSGLLTLAIDARVGEDLRRAMELDDRILTVKLTPNRPDCLSVLGIAREVSALCGQPLNAPPVTPVAAVSQEKFPVKISAPEGCGRFASRVIRNVNAAAVTPDWMKQRLKRAGQRPISALVDVTNYVMLELGRPLHVYDLDKLKSGIDVRFGRQGERVKLLNEQTVDLAPDVLAITDASGPIGLAGIMGGDSTKAETTTRHVLLESAFFTPQAIAGRARRYNFTSDASHRFERGVDFENCVPGIERATRLILDICGGEPGPTADTVSRLPERLPVVMRVSRAQKVIGVPVPVEEMAAGLARLGLSCRREGHGVAEIFAVTPPSYRFDIAIEEDVIEEVARMYGFERIPAAPPLARAAMRAQPEASRSLHSVRAELAAADYVEAVNYSFVDAAWEQDFAGNADPIKLLNPISSQMNVMRSTLAGSLVANVVYNVNRKLERVRMFEIGRVYTRDAAVGDGPASVAGLRQPMKVGGVAYGDAAGEQWGVKPARRVDFFDVKNDVENLLAPAVAAFEPAPHPALHPGRAAAIRMNGVVIGWLGELHPRLQQKMDLPAPPVLFEIDAAALTTARVPRFAEVSRFPAVTRDISVWVPEEATAGAMLEAMRRAGGALVQSVQLFDVFRPKGTVEGSPENKKSLAFRVVIQDTAKTLTDSEVDAEQARLLHILAERFGATQRA